MRKRAALTDNKINFLNSGQIGKYIHSFIDVLVEQGFFANDFYKRLYIIVDLNRWLINKKLKITKLSFQNIMDFKSDYSHRFKSVDGGLYKTSLNLFLNLLQQKKRY